MNRNLWNGQVEQFRLWVRRRALMLFFATVALGMTLILSYDLPGARQIDVAVDRPAPNDIFSPRALTFTSDLLTDQARDQATRAVADVYTPLDLGIGRAQWVWRAASSPLWIRCVPTPAPPLTGA